MGFVLLALRALAFVWVLLLTALIGNIIASNNNGHMATVNFSMFTAVWCWLAILFGFAASFIAALTIPIALYVLEGFAVLITFINAIVLAAYTRVPNCSNISGSSLPSNWIGYGSSDNEKRCRELQASTAFMWFLWATLAAILALTFKETRGSVGRSPSRASRGPSMSQV